MLSLHLSNIQVCDVESVVVLNPFPDLVICSLTLGRRYIHLIHINLHADVILRLRKFGQNTYRLDVRYGGYL